MQLRQHLPPRLRKQTPFITHLRKNTHKGTLLRRNSELAILFGFIENLNMIFSVAKGFYHKSRIENTKVFYKSIYCNFFVSSTEQYIGFNFSLNIIDFCTFQTENEKTDIKKDRYVCVICKVYVYPQSDFATWRTASV